MRFRRAALASVQSLDNLNRPVTLTGARSWTLMGILTAIMLVGTSWGAMAEIPRTVSATGLITTARGSFTVQTPADGQVLDVLVGRGAVVRPGQPLVRLLSGQTESEVRAPTQGRVFAVNARVGEVVTTGSALVVAEYAGSAIDEPVGVLYLRSSDLATVQAGARVDLAVAWASPVQFGVLRGRVQSVDDADSAASDMAAQLGGDEVADALTAKGAFRRVLVALDRDPQTTSGYAWSNRTGPPSPVTARTDVQALIHLPPARPIDWVFPS